ncbi:MAG TPA: AMP-binding protein, partial [Caulobacteraceae bacterium]|nr:AMP-binding protein [Caulobacteraceae bacterium]
MTAEPSWVTGPTEPPLLEITIGRALDEAAAKWGAELALISPQQGVRWTWADLARKADDLAAGLKRLGLEKGERIGVWSPNCAEWTLTQFAAARLGLVLVTINPAYRLSEVEYTLNKVGVKALVCAERFKTSDYAGMVETLAPELAASTPGALDAARLPSLKAVIQIGGAPRPGWLGFEAVAAPATDAERAEIGRIGATLDPR